jgi:serine/threonine-protein kinase RsbW
MQLSFALCLPRDGASVPFVRHLLRATLTRLGVEDDCLNDIEVALSEACTNVLRHAGTEDEYEVEVEVDDRSCRITVSYTGKGFVPAVRSEGGGVLPSEGGRGIKLMHALADDLHFETNVPGTVVELRKTLELESGSVLRQLTESSQPDGTDMFVIDPHAPGAPKSSR